MTGDGSSPDLADHLETAVEGTLTETVEWTFDESDGEYRLGLPDRQIVVSPRDSPDDGVYWTITLHSNGKIVSKFGPYESVESLLEQIETIVTTDVQYTVCCDG
jgi:hypothetical protein